MSGAAATQEGVPTLYQDILFHARTRPHAVAVVRGGKDVSYSAFRNDIDKVTRVLSREQLPADAVVAISANGHYLNWLVIIALARLGIVSVSIDAKQIDASGASVWITDEPGAETTGIRIVRPRPEWLDGTVADEGPLEDRVFRRGDPQRVVLSSGTTGTPKRALLTYGGFRQRYQYAALSYGFCTSTRFLTPMSPQVVAGWAFPAAAWCAGGTVILLGTAQLRSREDVVHAMRPNLMFCSPAQLAGMVERWPAGALPADGLTIYVGGAALPQAVSREARIRITPHLHLIYGSTEASTITMCHVSAADGRPGFAGYPTAYAQFEIVDDAHRPLPAGTTGVIRTRGEGMSVEYLRDAETTAQCFRDGWFYPGDTGSLDASGGLTIEGRVSELMNLGGTKMSPEVIDEALAGVEGVDELAAFGVPGEGGDQLWIAIVAQGRFDEAGLSRRFRERFPRLALPKLVQMREIPRNEMQKVMRAQLREKVRKGVRPR